MYKTLTSLRCSGMDSGLGLSAFPTVHFEEITEVMRAFYLKCAVTELAASV